MFADLHLHTCYSDGTYTPEELVSHARDKGLSAIALTDHDTVEGAERAAAACQSHGLEFITGTELTADQDNYELHILGYFLDRSNATLLKEIGACQAVRQDRIREMVARLNKLRVPLEAERVFALANCNSPGRPHVARALVHEGICKTLDEAFDRFLKKNRPAWVPKRRMNASDAIRLIHGAGGLAVMAHPGLNRTDRIVPSLVEQGLDGIECFHTRHSTLDSERYLEMADRYGLLVTGGSDCHGESKGRPLIGTIKLPYQHVQRLKEVVKDRKRAAAAEPPPPSALNPTS